MKMCSKSLTHILQEVEFHSSCLQSQQKSVGLPHPFLFRVHVTRCGAPAASHGSCDCVLSCFLVAASTYWCVIGWSGCVGWRVIGWRAADWLSAYAVSALFSRPARRAGRRCSGSAGWWGTGSRGTTSCRWPGRCCRACLGAGGHPGVRWNDVEREAEEGLDEAVFDSVAVIHTRVLLMEGSDQQTLFCAQHPLIWLYLNKTCRRDQITYTEYCKHHWQQQFQHFWLRSPHKPKCLILFSNSIFQSNIFFYEFLYLTFVMWSIPDTEKKKSTFMTACGSTNFIIESNIIFYYYSIWNWKKLTVCSLCISINIWTFNFTIFDMYCNVRPCTFKQILHCSVWSFLCIYEYIQYNYELFWYQGKSITILSKIDWKLAWILS